MTTKKAQAKTIKQISDIRARNNLLWMSLLELALQSSPKKAKFILAAINQNDKEISDLLSSL